MKRQGATRGVMNILGMNGIDAVGHYMNFEDEKSSILLLKQWGKDYPYLKSDKKIAGKFPLPENSDSQRLIRRFHENR